MVFARDINLIFWLLLASFTTVVFSCVARPNGVKRVSPRHAFYLHQRVPDIDEFSEGASGKPMKPIRRNSKEYHRLPRLYNPGIIFYEGNYPETGDTRVMSKRCIDALNKLEKLVKQVKRWSKIKLRVMAAWDEEPSHKHDSRSLHYEGRAVDITTSDGDRSKLGLLARLAVEAGFDWVRFHRHRVHASVRADGEGRKVMGCFRSNSTVHLEGGKTKTLDQLKIGDKVQSVTQDGKLIYSEVFMFIDNKPEEKNVLYFVLETEKPKRKLYLTKSHMVYVRRRFSSIWGVQFAKNVQEKDFINVSSNGALVAAEVTRISVALQRGAVAPLTHEGNIIVDGVLASCYALLDNQRFVDTIFSPAKTLHKYFPALLNGNNVQQGVHWYARLLLFLNDYLSVLT